MRRNTLRGKIIEAISVLGLLTAGLSGCSPASDGTVNSGVIRETTTAGTTSKVTQPGRVPAVTTTAVSITKPLTKPIGTAATTSAVPETNTERTSAEPEDPIARIIDQMTLDQKIRQMLLVHFPIQYGSTSQTVEYGGYLFFSDFFKERTPKEVTSLLKKINDHSEVPLPVLFAVDEEGGTVNRISLFSQYGVERFKSPQEIYENGGIEALIKDTDSKAHFLKNLGINLNLAPVADVSSDPNSFIYDRTMGLSAHDTAAAISAITAEMKKEQMLSSLKHFPGYGDNVDTHTDIAIDNSTLAQLKSRLEPFRAGINSGADSLMVSHIIMTVFDQSLPASLSVRAHQYIREDLNFKGVIMTDDLQMKGLTKVTDEPFVAAVLAGNDLLITDDPEGAVKTIRTAVANKTISEAQIDESLLRILKMKASLKP